MIRMLIAFFLLLQSTAFAFSNNEYESLLKEWAPLSRADAELGATWKENTRHLKKEDREFILKDQRSWLATERDAEARGLAWAGYDTRCAYLLSTLHRIAILKAFGYNAGLSQEDQDAGRVKADDFFFDDSGLPEECNKN